MKIRKNINKLSRQKLIIELDNVFSVFIRLRDCDNRGIVTCPLCGARIHRKKAQNMHFISRGVMKYRYDEKNCHAGCMRCNVYLNGNYIVYTRRMQRQYGISFVDSLIADKSVYKIPTPALVEMINYYAQKADVLSDKKNILF